MSRSSDKGKYLVICCEGNAGFYEVGIIGAPMKMGYSVVGWNHPGFGESTVCSKYTFLSLAGNINLSKWINTVYYNFKVSL